MLNQIFIGATYMICLVSINQTKHSGTVLNQIVTGAVCDICLVSINQIKDSGQC